MAMDDLTDDEQLERVKRAVADNWVWVAGGIVLGAALIFGYRYYDGYRDDRALRAAAQFDDMTAALEHNDAARSRQIAAGLIQDFPTSPYADQAQLVLARLAIDAGNLAAANAPLTQVMNNSKDGELKRIARLRLARVLTGEGKPDDALMTLGPDASGAATPGVANSGLTRPGVARPDAFTALYHEVRGDAYYAKKDYKNAGAEYMAALGAQGLGSASAGGASAGRADTALLQLKIADLGAKP